jgi:hypothetical protein
MTSITEPTAMPHGGVAAARDGIASSHTLAWQQQVGAAVLFLLMMLFCLWDASAVLLGTVDLVGTGAADGDLPRQVCFLLLFAATLAATGARSDLRLFLAVSGPCY